MKRSVLSLSLLVAFPLLALQAQAAVLPAATELAEKQELVRGNGTEVASLDPHKVESTTENAILVDLFETLLINDPDGKLIPGAATHWESADNQIWTFHLRKDAKWSNGEPITANDFVYAWRRLVDPKTASPYASYPQFMLLENVDDVMSGKKAPEELGIKAIDDYTLEIRLSGPVAYMPKMLNHYSLAPLNQKAVEAHGIKWTEPGNMVGNGPFKLAEHIVNEKIVVVRNPEYWDNANTVLEKVTFLPIESDVAENSRYRAGEIDMTLTWPLELKDKLKKELPDEVKTSPNLCVYYYEINNQRPPFTDARVRAALKLALDQSIITDKVLGEGQLPAYSLTHVGTDGAQLVKPEWTSWTQEKRNEEAKILLAEAGFNESNPLSFTLMYNTSEGHKKIALAATQMWKKNLGAEVKLENQEWKTFLDTRRAGNYDVARDGWCADYNEPTAFLNTMHSQSINNSAHYKNIEYDKLLDEALLTEDDAERTRLYQAAEAIADKDTPKVPVYYYTRTRLVKPYVGGFTGNDAMDNIRDKDLYIIKH